MTTQNQAEKDPPRSKPDANDPHKHPSYGVAKVSTKQGPERSLFMAKSLHSHIVGIDISEAVLSRGEIFDTPAEAKMLLRLEMTTTQFIDLVTGAQSGRVTPVTLIHVNGDEAPRPEPPRYEPERTFQRKLSQSLRETTTLLDELIEGAKGKTGDKLRKIKKNLVDEIPYIEREFDRSRDRMITEDRAALEAELKAHIQSLELKKVDQTKLLEGREREEDWPQ